MNKERMKQIIAESFYKSVTEGNCIAEDLIVNHPEIEAMFESEDIDLERNYASIKCCNRAELQYVLEYAKSQGKKCGELLSKLTKFPVLIYLDGDIVGWNNYMDRIGKKYSFIRFVEYVNKGATK